MSKAGFIEILLIDKIGDKTRGQDWVACPLQDCIPTAKPELALPSPIGLILKGLQGLHLAEHAARAPQGRQIALSSGYFLHTNSRAKEKASRSHQS